jgi:hypothetical protein
MMHNTHNTNRRLLSVLAPLPYTGIPKHTIIMGKRGNELGQLSKEEYDAHESRGSSQPAVGEGFTKASDDQLAKRRMFRSSE